MKKSLLQWAIDFSGASLPEGYDSWGMKVVGYGRRTRNQFFWPEAGNSVRSWDLPKGYDPNHGDPCARYSGDGLCLGRTPSGLASGGFPFNILLLCAYRSREVIGEDGNKIRTSGDIMVCSEIDLAHCSFHGVDLDCLKFQGVAARGHTFSNCRFRTASFERAALQEFILDDVQARSVNFVATDFTGALIKHSVFTECDFDRATFRNAVIRNSAFSYCSFTRADFVFLSSMGDCTFNNCFFDRELHDFFFRRNARIDINVISPRIKE